MQEGCSREVGGGVELMGAGEARVEGMGKCLERFVEDWFKDKQMPKADVFRKKWVEIRFERKPTMDTLSSKLVLCPSEA